MNIDKTINAYSGCSGYSEILDKPDICVKKNKLLIKLSDFIFKTSIQKHFYSVRVKNKQNYYQRNPDYANLFYGFHSCWWDGPLAIFLCRTLYDCNIHMMIKDLYRFPALSFIGGFSIEKDSFHGSVKAINYCVELLKDSENSLWLFPQGEVVSPDFRPICFESGIFHIYKKLTKLNFIPVAYRYTFLRNQKPEILVEIGKPIIIGNDIKNKALFLNYIQKEFEDLLEAQRLEIAEGNLENYEYILQNTFNWPEIIENKLKPLLRMKF